MKYVLALFIAGVSAATSQAERPAAQPQSGSDRVAISYVSEDPGFGSGILAVAVKVSGTTASGDRDYFIPFMDVGQAKPHVGEVCQLDWTWFPGDFDWLLANGERITSGRKIDTFRCEAKHA